MLTKDPL
jgi:hypothetical protein